MARDRFMKNLRAAIGFTAAPYGYTLATWTSGAVLAYSHGIPDVFETLAFMCGAVLGFAAVGTFAFGSLSGRVDSEPGEGRLLWGNFHFLPVGLAIVASDLVARHVEGFVAWPAAAFLYTSVYLLGVGVESTVAQRWDRSRK